MAGTNKGRGDTWQARENAYVRHQMGREQVEAFKTWLQEQEASDKLALLEQALLSGCEIKVLKRSGGYTAVLHDPEREQRGVSFLLTGWSKTGYDALWLVLWKDAVVADGDWSTLEANAPEAPEYR